MKFEQIWIQNCLFNVADYIYRLHFCFPYCKCFWVLTFVDQNKMRTSKLHCNAEKTCYNWMWQLSSYGINQYLKPLKNQNPNTVLITLSWFLLDITIISSLSLCFRAMFPTMLWQSWHLLWALKHISCFSNVVLLYLLMW